MTAGRSPRTLFILGVAFLLAVAGTACGGPTTKDELCAAYDDLSDALRGGGRVFNNELFRSADKLGKLAERYEESTKVKEDGQALRKIADSTTTSGLELQAASSGVASACGKPPLGFNALFGN